MLFRQYALTIFCSIIMLVSGIACADTKTSKAQANLKQETQKQLSSDTDKTTHSEKKEFSNQQLYGRSAESISFKKGKKGKKGKAPKNWKPVPGSGTNQEKIDWLYHYVIKGNNLVECRIAVQGFCIEHLPWIEHIPSDQREKIVADCRKKSTAMAKVLCASKKIKKLFKDDKTQVCRHHAWALWYILDDLGLPSDLECGVDQEGHAWVETEVDGKRVIVDSYNGIHIIVN